MVVQRHQSSAVRSQNCACPLTPRPSQHRWCTSVILSTGLQMPVQFQSKDAAHGFPACAFHSQSGGVPQQRLLSSTCSTSNPINQDPNDTSSFEYLCRICRFADM
uniref:Uncharacterized protein n=1 Tax=Arundo donax TaxID=35708 RepID=A0A0A8YDS6_ARUDO